MLDTGWADDHVSLLLCDKLLIRVGELARPVLERPVDVRIAYHLAAVLKALLKEILICRHLGFRSDGLTCTFRLKLS